MIIKCTHRNNLKIYNEYCSAHTPLIYQLLTYI